MPGYIIALAVRCCGVRLAIVRLVGLLPLNAARIEDALRIHGWL